MAKAKKREFKKFITPVFRASYVHLFKPQAAEDGGTPKFGVSAVWTPGKFSDSEKKLWAAIKAEGEAAFEAFHGMTVEEAKDIGGYVLGIRDGRAKKTEPYGPGTVFASLTSTQRPGIVDLDGNPIGAEHMNQELVYSGVYARASVNWYAFDNKSKGIALGLNNFQLVRAAEPLGMGQQDASEDFGSADAIDDRWLDTDGGDADDGAGF